MKLRGLVYGSQAQTVLGLFPITSAGVGLQSLLNHSGSDHAWKDQGDQSRSGTYCWPESQGHPGQKNQGSASPGIKMTTKHDCLLLFYSLGMNWPKKCQVHDKTQDFKSTGTALFPLFDTIKHRLWFASLLILHPTASWDADGRVLGEEVDPSQQEGERVVCVAPFYHLRHGHNANVHCWQKWPAGRVCVCASDIANLGCLLLHPYSWTW